MFNLNFTSSESDDKESFGQRAWSGSCNIGVRHPAPIPTSEAKEEGCQAWFQGTMYLVLLTPVTY